MLNRIFPCLVVLWCDVRIAKQVVQERLLYINIWILEVNIYSSKPSNQKSALVAWLRSFAPRLASPVLEIYCLKYLNRKRLWYICANQISSLWSDFFDVVHQAVPGSHSVDSVPVAQYICSEKEARGNIQYLAISKSQIQI